MRKRIWIPLCICLLVVLVRAGVEWGPEDEGPARATAVVESVRTLVRRGPPTRAPLASPSVAAATFADRDSDAATRGAPQTATSVVRRSEELRWKPPANIARAIGAELPKPAGRREHHGDLGRATLKSGHLRDRTRESLGGGDLRDLLRNFRRSGSLSEARLATRHLRYRTRERLGGADLRELSRIELGKRALKSGHLRDLSRGEDDYGDLADRSGH